MPKKIDSHSSYGQKLISIFARLLFSNEKYSLIDLAKMLDCSKQTVMRSVEDIRKAYGVDIEDSTARGRKFYHLKKRSLNRTPALALDLEEMQLLQMCRAFTEHLLGKGIFSEVTRAVDKTRALLPEGLVVPGSHFASYQPGCVDYTPHQEAIRSIIRAMDLKKVCKISYRASMSKTAKTFYVEPLKLFSCRNTLYLHAHKARTPGKKFKEPEFDPLLAVHRIEKVTVTELSYKFPSNYDFDKFFTPSFGIIKDGAFELVVEFTGYAASYVGERIWSPKQVIEKKGEDGVAITFAASSEPELISWILSWGSQAKVLSPDWLVEKVKIEARKVIECYTCTKSKNGPFLS